MSNVVLHAKAGPFFILFALLGRDANFTTGLRLFSAPTFLLIRSDNAPTAQPPVVMRKMTPRTYEKQNNKNKRFTALA